MFKTRALPPPPAKVSGSPQGLPQQGLVRAIVKVDTCGHVPSQVVLRSRIDDTMFTCEFDVAALAALAADPRVVSISAAQAVMPAGSEPGPVGSVAEPSPPAASPKRPARRKKP